MDWKLGKLERHLVVVVSLSVLLHDLNDPFALLGSEAIDLSNQVVSLLNGQWFFVEVYSRLSSI